MILKASMREGLVVAWQTNGLFLGLEVDALDGLAIERGRQVVDDGVEQRLHALVLEGRAAEDRVEHAADDGLADQALEGLLVGLLPVEIGGHRVVVEFDGGLDAA